jgi:hypothetical protein
MQDFYRAFIRNRDGSWTCTAPVTLEHPAGRIQVVEGARFYPGSTFMGIDVARWLERERAGLENA